MKTKTDNGVMIEVVVPVWMPIDGGEWAAKNRGDAIELVKHMVESKQLTLDSAPYEVRVAK